MTAPAAVIRRATSADRPLALPASELIASLASENDLARRSVEFLEDKICSGQAVVAVRGGELVGFGYWAAWEDGAFISHSGLVVRRDLHGQGLGRRLKMALAESSQVRHPRGVLMSLTTSPQVKALNLSLGFRVVPLDQLTSDPRFWAGCNSCRNIEKIRASGQRCCCEGMVLVPATFE